jgi:RNA polymerase sigma factor (sigma-70 family)
MFAESESSRATRPSLLARLKDWSQQTAWREFDHNYAPLLRNVARKAGLSDVEADEVVQETLIAVAKKIGEFDHAGNRGSFRAWLYQQARWRIADRFRARSRAHYAIAPEDSLAALGHLEPAPAAEAQSDQTFERLWEAEWENYIGQAAIARVKRQAGARQFQLFDLHVIQGLTVQAAAQAAGASTAAVFMAKSRVGRLVRKEIARLRRTCQK